MAVSRLVMQEWKDQYDLILNKSNIEELLSGLYVDDGREVHRLLRLGERYVEEDNMFKVIADKAIEDIENSVT